MEGKKVTKTSKNPTQLLEGETVDGMKATIKHIQTMMFIIPSNSRISVVTYNNIMHCKSRTLSSAADSQD